MHKMDRNRSFSHSGGYSLHVARADIADGEHPRQAGRHLFRDLSGQRFDDGNVGQQLRR
jgi:hypothetical protein